MAGGLMGVVLLVAYLLILLGILCGLQNLNWDQDQVERREMDDFERWIDDVQPEDFNRGDDNG